MNIGDPNIDPQIVGSPYKTGLHEGTPLMIVNPQITFSESLVPEP